MRRASVALAAVLLGTALSGVGQAASLGFSGQLAVQISNLSPVVYPGSGVAVINGSTNAGQPLTQLSLAAGIFYLSQFVLPVTDPSVFPIAGIQVTAGNGAGNFAATPSGFGGPMPLLGLSKVCLFGPCSVAVQNLSVPLSNVGIGGTATVQGAVNLTVVGAPWTSGTAAVGSVTQMGVVSYPGGGGPNVQLVTPIFISTNIPASAVVPTFGFLSVHILTPEPGTLLLVGAGLLGLVGFAKGRR